MESPILNSIIQSANSHFPPPILLFHFPSISRERNNADLRNPHPKSRATLLRFPTFAPIRAASSNSAQLNFRGWDDDFLKPTGDDWEAANTGESSFRLRDFVVSIGINDKRYAFTFLLGAVFAFAISRVRVSYIALVPASAVVFAVGFSFGFVRSGTGLSLFSANTVKRKANEASSRLSSDRVNAAVAEFLNEFGVKVSELKDSLLRAIDSREIKMDDLEHYVHVIEAMETSALNTRRSIEATADSIENPKPVSRKRRQIGEVGSELVQSLVSRMFQPKRKVVSRPKTNKVKENDNVEPVATVSLSSDPILEIEEGGDKDVIDSKGSPGSVSSQGFPSKLALDWDGDRRIRIVSDHMQERVDAEASSAGDPSFLDSDGAYSSYSTKTNHGQTYSSSSYMEDSRRSNEDLHLMDRQDVPWSEAGSSSPSSSYSSSAVSDDVAFNRYLTEANSLLKEAKECIRGRQEEEHAEVLLYKSAKLLTKSVALKPMSLLAVGQLGNTYLLHGELKLKISRELRATLSTWGPLSFENQGSVSVGPNELKRKDKLVEILTNVCEECEELLVEAGRKYRTALSIDGNDMRALYNWGLALTFRAQLIADIGPEAAFDADKLFLAATDKFDAMMSKSNVHAPDALFRWGLVLQQRSRLRPANSKEKVKLLQQAKRLYEDALRMDSDNVQVREALSTCMSDLNRRLFRSF
ncbi:unnamed protein product [Linum trigynum]|uniref:Uncharacterized protein n=1 Tax=Linum trigynum TaxID=586398 RepID=A0AAV2CZT9_9ROSI